jgi:hypothetical protein
MVRFESNSTTCLPKFPRQWPWDIVTATQLIVFGRVDAPQADAGAVDFERVAVDDAGLTSQVVGCGGGRWR